MGKEFDVMSNFFEEPTSGAKSISEEDLANFGLSEVNEQDGSALFDFDEEFSFDLEEKQETEELLPVIPELHTKPDIKIDTTDIDLDTGRFGGNEFTETDLENMGKDTVKPDNFSIESTLQADTFDSFSILKEEELKFPYFVFSATGNLGTIASLCSGILTRGEVTLYFRPEPENPNKLIPVSKIASTPINIRNLLRLSRRESVFFRYNQESVERLATPEQFIMSIDLGLKEDETYWNALIEEEKNGKSADTPIFAEDLFA